MGAGTLILSVRIVNVESRASHAETSLYSQANDGKSMLKALPGHLGERTRHRNSISGPQGSGPVVVWLKSSFRLDENPAIEVGRHIAAQHDLPLLIYHGIDERYPHASLRHHSMLLDAAVDMDD